MQSYDRTFEEDKPEILLKIKEIALRFRGIIHFALGFILADACLLGYIRPFGLCYAMAQKEDDRLWACGGVFVGSLMIYGTKGMIYGAACILALAIDAFLLTKSPAREIFLPLVLAGIIMVIKAPFAIAAGAGYLGMLLLEGGLTVLCCYCLLLTSEGEKGRMRQAVLAIMFIIAFANMKLFGLLSPSGVAAVTLTMVITFGCPAFHGAAFGLIIGAFLDMAEGGGPFFAAAFGIASVVAGFLPRKGRISFAMSFLLAGIASLLWGFGEPRAMGCIYDFFVAASVFLLLPDNLMGFSLEQTVAAGGANDFPPVETASSRLSDLSRAISAISRSAGEHIVGTMEGEEDISVIFDNSARMICRSCSKCNECWIEDYVTTFGSLNDLLPQIRQKGHIKTVDLPPPFSSKCIKKGDMCASINSEYMSYLRRRAGRAREESKNILLREQYEGIGKAVDGIAGAAREDYVSKPVAEKQVRGILAAYRKGLWAEVFMRSGRINIRIGYFDSCELWEDEQSFVRSAELALGKKFLPAEVISVKDGDIFLYKEQETFAVSVSCAVRKKPGEEVCGDSSIYFKTDDGRALIMLSDGMGAGREASRLSRNALELISAFAKSGCSVTESALAVIPFLKGRYTSLGFATLDLLEIDLFTGLCQLIKCGASDSYIVEDGQKQTLSSPSLPPVTDFENEKPVKPVTVFVKHGSRIIMTSDGADISASEILTKNELSAGDLIRECAESSTDDFTAIVITIREADKNIDERQ
ncbi:MAG: SpoIIE family protein phosphatase [Clostridiaceae bacterium]|nr:SpoIIE family protein phosphatase [Clostridiaceae bacterium]